MILYGGLVTPLILYGRVIFSRCSKALLYSVFNRAQVSSTFVSRRLLTPIVFFPNVTLLIQYGLCHPQDSKTFPLARVASICQSCTWSAEQEKRIFPCPRLVCAWEFGLARRVRQSRRVSLLIPILRLNLVLTYGIPPDFRGGVHLFIYNRHTPSGQSRVYRVTQLIASRWC